MLSPPNIIGGKTGRLLEARVFPLRNAAEARVYSRYFLAAADSIEGRVVILADDRPVAIYPPQVADVLKSLMVRMNAKVERSGILVAASHATSAMQSALIAAETPHEARRRFTDVVEILAWLGALLSPEEQFHAAAFLASFQG